MTNFDNASGKFECRSKTSQAIKKGIIKKAKHCDKCDVSKIEAHHPDYTKPLEIKWLCKKHHKEEDKLKRIAYPNGFIIEQLYTLRKSPARKADIETVRQYYLKKLGKVKAPDSEILNFALGSVATLIRTGKNVPLPIMKYQ